ncbi:hypothetical protein E1265_08875 [Streptomyces sp. 8K308]|uniref:WapI family immunity protein n=1 Tax=Streptomyces sp. 8K308 TaxID=2530388 RepID=UPI00104BB520|nr:hypothetical protein [Streptomyces sp. 8K308]TDC24711.1 hypothetical protein E1265_08875 [Streptomyces sp. 8K308]
MLIADERHRLELRPVGYQFPAAVGDHFDDNWLVVAGAVTTPEGSWSFTDPCLLVAEARSIGPWLRTFCGSDPVAPPAVLDFLEPLLAFRRDDAGTLGVRLSHESMPPWCAGDERWGEYEFAVDTTAERLRRAAEEWELALRSFPPR